MTSTETEAKPGRGGARGPRVFKDVPTDRDRVIGTSLAAKAKELTGRDISLLDVLAVKFSLSRWYEDPATKDLLNNMDNQLKKATAQRKAEKARKDLEEAEKELGDIDEDDSDDADDELTAEAADEGDEDEDVFDDDTEKVSADF